MVPNMFLKKEKLTVALIGAKLGYVQGGSGGFRALGLGQYRVQGFGG